MYQLNLRRKELWTKIMHQEMQATTQTTITTTTTMQTKMQTTTQTKTLATILTTITMLVKTQVVQTQTTVSVRDKKETEKVSFLLCDRKLCPFTVDSYVRYT